MPAHMLRKASEAAKDTFCPDPVKTDMPRFLAAHGFSGNWTGLGSTKLGYLNGGPPSGVSVPRAIAPKSCFSRRTYVDEGVNNRQMGGASGKAQVEMGIGEPAEAP